MYYWKVGSEYITISNVKLLIKKRKIFLLITLLLFSLGSALVVWNINKENEAFPFLTKEEQHWFRSNKNSITLLFGYQAPPNAFHDKRGAYEGLLVDYAKEINKRLDWIPERKMFTTWNDLINYSKTASNFYIVGIAPTEERSEFLAFTDTFIEIPYIIVTRKNSPPAKSLSELKNIKTGVVKNYAVGEFIRKNYEDIPLIETSDNLDGLRKTATGDIHAMILNQSYASYLIESQGLSNLVISGTSEYKNKLAVAVSSDELMLKNILNKVLKSIETSDRKKITRKWISGMTQHRTWRDWLIITLPFLGILALITGITLAWIVSLKRTVARQTKEIRKDRDMLKTALEEKRVLLKELNHRTKNNLQLVNSLLTLHMSSENSPKINTAFNEMKNRIHSISLVHEMLYKTHELKEIKLNEYLKTLITHIDESFMSEGKKIELFFEMQEIHCPLEQATQLGLISNELILNCYKHAFTDKKEGRITIILKKLPNKEIRLCIADNGTVTEKEKTHTGIGLITVETLTSQLKGTLKISRDKGMDVYIDFKPDVL